MLGWPLAPWAFFNISISFLAFSTSCHLRVSHPSGLFLEIEDLTA